ncbi:MAG: hypothetical protein AAGN46_08500 [Acidobacteriota bacterium]
MKALVRIPLILLLLAVLATAGCDDYVEETDQGGVILQVEIDPVLIFAGVNDGDGDAAPFDTLTITNNPARPNGNTSTLMDVNVDTLEVTYTRADTGTRVPPPFVFRLAGIAPINGTLVIQNGFLLSRDQVLRPPLSDLLFENGGIDPETGASSIRLNASIRIFGQTVGGEDVASLPRVQTIEVRPTLLGTGL